MLKFNGIRSLKDFKKIVADKKWLVNSDRYDNGDDHVSVFFTVEKDGTQKKGWALISFFNGRFFGGFGPMDGGKIEFNSDVATHDQESWFQELLKAVYIEAVPVLKVKRVRKAKLPV